MSGEFGDGQFFHYKVQSCFEDLQGHSDPLMAAYAKLFEPLAHVARDISWWQAGDSSKSRAYKGTAEVLSSIESGLHRLRYEIEAMLEAEAAAYLDGARSSLPEPSWQDGKRDGITLKLTPGKYIEEPSYEQIHRREVRERAIHLYVNEWAVRQGEKHYPGWRWSSRGGGMNEDTWHFRRMSWHEGADRVLHEVAAIVQNGSEFKPADTLAAVNERILAYRSEAK